MSPTQIVSNPALPLANKPMCTGKKRQASTLDVPAGFKFRVLGPLYLGLVLALSHGLAKANPQGGQVVAGSASFTFPSERQLVINQTSERAILDWQRFSIGAGENTRFVQPTASSVVLNRVVGGDPSEILGRLSANGQVFLSNPNGILFGPDARVDVHGLVATTHGIRNQDFMAGDYRFSLPGKPESSVVNQGTISIADAGMAALVAPAVRNDGLILARLGQVALASSTGFTLDLYGDRLLELAVDPVTLKALLPDGSPVTSLVDNAGQIVADGGAVMLTANAVRTVVDKVINVSGLVSARSARMENGAIVLEGGEGGVNLSGTLDVSAARSDGTGDGDGGTVYVLGERVTLTPSARILADGGGLAGHGGFVETSGQVVSIEDGARVSAVASSGNSGTWLIDPNDITISTAMPDANITPNPFTDTVSSSADSSFITVNSLLASLNAGTSVVISTGTAGANTQQGNITVANDINKTLGSDATLTLNAHNNIILNASITSSSGKLNMVFNPDSDGNMIGRVTLGNTTLNANGGTISAAGKTVNLPAVAPAPTAIVDSDMTIGTLVLNDGTLNGTGNFTIGTAKLTGGTLGGTGNLTVTTDFDMSGAAILGLTFNNLSLNRTGNFVVPVAGFTALNSVTLNSGGTVTLNGTVSGAGTGNAVTISGTGFNNTVGATGITATGGGRWLVYSDNWDMDARGGLTGNSTYNRTFTGNPPASISETGNLFIYRRQPTLTITGDNLARVYGDANPTLTFAVAGTVNGDTGAYAYTGTPTLSTTAITTSNIGAYPITVAAGTNASSVGYAFAYAPGTLMVGTRAITVTPNAGQSKAYGAANPVYAYTVGGAGQIGTDALTGSLGRAAGENVGNYALLQDTLAASANYAVTFTGGVNFGITPAPLSITANSTTKIYGQLQSFTGTEFSSTGLKNGETIGSVTLLSLGTSANASVSNSPYAIVGSNAIGGSFISDNYAITYNDGALTVTPAVLTVTALNATKTYDGMPWAGGNGVAYAGFVNGEAEDVLGGRLIFGGNAQGATSPGNYLISQSGLTSVDYAIAYVDGTLTVQPAPATVVAPAQVKNLDAAADVPLIVAGQAVRPLSLTPAQPDTLPPTAGPGSGQPLPKVEQVGFAKALDMVLTPSYSPEDRASFYRGLGTSDVVPELKQVGQDELAQFFADTAAGKRTNEAQLNLLLDRRIGITQEQRVGYTGVFDRMRHLAMTNLLSGALSVLRQDPYAADEYDDGVAGGPIRIITPPRVSTPDGLAFIKGQVESASQMLYLRVQDRWAFVDPDGRFEVKVPVTEGESPLVIEANDPADARTKIGVWVESRADGTKHPALIQMGKKVALLIGVEEYDHGIPELETPLGDALAVAGKLRDGYGFDARVLANPTKMEVLKALEGLSRELGERDSLMVFYAGHGYMTAENGRGYWLPRDAETNSPKNWISNRDVARLFHRTPSKQVFMISDSCYSGAFTKEGAKGQFANAETRNLRAVMALSSGGEQPVWDGGGDGHSVFAARLLALLDAGKPLQGAKLFGSLSETLEKASPQVPGYGSMVSAGYDPGADYALK